VQEPVNPHKDYLKSYWEDGFAGKPLSACTGQSPMSAYFDGKRARESMLTVPTAPVPLTDGVVQKIISKLEPLLDAKNQSWAEAERMLHGIREKGNT
jgi:hypothetical protein